MLRDVYWRQYPIDLLNDEKMGYIESQMPAGYEYAPYMFYITALKLADDDGIFALDDGVIFARLMRVKDIELVYAVANVAKVDYGASDDMYGIITDFGRSTDEDGDRIYVVSILSEGEEATYECTADLRETFEVGDLIKFNVSDESIKETTSPAAPTTLVAYSVVEAVEDLVDEDLYNSYKMEYYKVDAIDADTIEFKWVTEAEAEDCAACVNGTVTTTAACTATHAEGATDCDACENGTVTTTAACTATHATEKTTNYRIVDLDEEVVVYDLVAGDMGEISEGDYVLVFNTDSDAANLMDIVVIIK